jgi:hypothetical protein
MRGGALVKICKLFSFAAVAVLALGMSAGIASADGGDPRGQVHTPTVSGTPGVGDLFDLAPFGTSNDLCTFANGEEDCTVKNLSGFNWTSLTIATSASSCAGISTSTDLFGSSSCNVVGGQAVLDFAGVAYSQGAQSFINYADSQAGLCFPAGSCTGGQVQQSLLTGPLESGFMPYCASSASGGAGGTPGVLAGCDVEFSFFGDGSGNWATGTSFSVQAPEPSTMSFLALGLLAMVFLGSRFRNANNEQ